MGWASTRHSESVAEYTIARTSEVVCIVGSQEHSGAGIVLPGGKLRIAGALLSYCFAGGGEAADAGGKILPRTSVSSWTRVPRPHQ
jgi:hypothetical protein